MKKIKLQLRVSVNCSKIHNPQSFVFIVMKFIQTSNLLTSQVQNSRKEANMTTSSEKFCLNWNDFHENISSTFQEMRDHLDLADVTLACEDDKKSKLTSLFSYIQFILHENPEEKQASTSSELPEGNESSSSGVDPWFWIEGGSQYLPGRFEQLFSNNWRARTCIAGKLLKVWLT